MADVKSCGVIPCANAAVADVEWGSMPQQEALCKVHIDDLWERFRGHVAANLLHFRIGPVGSIKAQTNANVPQV